MTRERSPADDARALHMRPIRDVVLPRPKATPSGLFPAVQVQPLPIAGPALRLRRAVGLTVLLGTVCLLAYASWQRAAHARAPVASAAAPVEPGIVVR